jgi:L-amino acid N-acyltransferase YncA
MTNLADSTTAQSIRVRRAKFTEIPEILAILSQHFVSTKDTLVAADLEKSGFLLSQFSEDEARAAINNKADFVFLVATPGDTVMGYAIGCNVKKLNPTNRERLAAISSELHHAIFSEKVFFLRHIAKKPADNRVGGQLLDAIEAEAHVAGYHHILCSIAHQPLENKRSKAFFEKHGYTCAGFNQIDNLTGAIYWKKI